MGEKKDFELPDLKLSTRHLHHNFIGDLGLLSNDMWFESSGKDPSFTVTAELCQKRLSKAYEDITKVVEELRQGIDYLPVKQYINRLEEFSAFLLTFMQEGRMLTKEDVSSITDRFWNDFPKAEF